jgi:hypothetical protein
MKWVNISNSSTKEIFELQDDEKVLADISFSKQTRFVRIVSDLGRRMFSFEKSGFLHHRKIIRDEYGIKFGKVEEDKHGKGNIELDGKKYAFVYEENGSGDLIIYDESMQKNLLRCNFKAIANTFNKTTSLLDTKFASLLLLLCWYSFQPHNTEGAKLLSNSDLMLA